MEQDSVEVTAAPVKKMKTSSPEMKELFDQFMDDKTRLDWFFLAKSKGSKETVIKNTGKLTGATCSEAFTVLGQMGRDILDKAPEQTFEMLSLHMRSGLYEAFKAPEGPWIVNKNPSYVPGH